MAKSAALLKKALDSADAEIQEAARGGSSSGGSDFGGFGGGDSGGGGADGGW